MRQLPHLFVFLLYFALESIQSIYEGNTMIHESIHELNRSLTGIVGVQDDRVDVLDAEHVRTSLIDVLIRDAVFGTKHVRTYAKWLIWEIGQALGVRPASIHELYMARARGEYADTTVAAMNLRMMSYDMIRAAMRAANKRRAGAIIFELARSEMAFSFQGPDEYSACVIAAAIREGYPCPLFIQGDHFQVNHTKYAANPQAAIQEVKDLAAASIPWGFWNIDIDTSTLVDLAPADLVAQQKLNFERSAEISAFVRSLEPDGITISLGGEIGEVGLANSTVAELDTYMENYARALAQYGDYAGLSKVSVATGTTHGGVILADGSIGDVTVDFDLLDRLGARAREHGAGGAVQHGASTLPRTVFQRFPQSQTLEIHLAAGFVNLVFDHPHFPTDLMQAIHAHLAQYHSHERKTGDTDAQFYHKMRKNAAGPFKAELWALPHASYEAIMPDLEEFFGFLIDELGAANTADLVNRVVSAIDYHQPKPTFTRAAAQDTGLAD